MVDKIKPVQSPAKILVFISGRGSNLKALIEKERDYSIVGVITDNPGAQGIHFASEAGIPVQIVERAKYSSKEDFNVSLLKVTESFAPDYIAIAGFMRIIPKSMIDSFQNKIRNIHPSLLPKFPGLDTHRRVLEAKESVHGCTVHIVDQGIDTGKIIAQASLKVLDGELEDSLSKRVLDLEHALYPWVLSQVSCNNIRLQSDRIIIEDVCRNEGKELGFKLSANDF